jgi:low molecular weight protein-tyrosine phosphatase
MGLKDGSAQPEEHPVPLHRELLSQPVRRNPVQLRGRENGPALEGIVQGLALERGINNVGPMAVAAVKALQLIGLRVTEEFTRSPAQVTMEDLEQADRIVALKEAEHLPLLQERFPAWAEKVEYWQVDDAPEVLGLIEREVMDLTARLIGGGKRREARMQETTTEAVDPVTKKEVIKTSAPVVRLGRETKGRRGKGVSTVADLPVHVPILRDYNRTTNRRVPTFMVESSYEFEQLGGAQLGRPGSCGSRSIHQF